MAATKKKVSDLLESVQCEAAKTVTGAIKGTNRGRLLCDVGWEIMKTRTQIHKLILLYKIINGMSPKYLNSLLPQQVGEKTSYSLRNTRNLTNFCFRTERFARSFFPSAIKLWNKFGFSASQDIDSNGGFKKILKNVLGVPVPNNLYNYAIDRYSSINHTRLRIDACGLNYYLYKINCKPSPACQCGHPIESISHFFLSCPLFASPRQTLLSSAAQILDKTWTTTSKKNLVTLFLCGSKRLTDEQNKNIFCIVQNH